MDGEAKKSYLPQVCLGIFFQLCVDLPEPPNFLPIEHFLKYDAPSQR